MTIAKILYVIRGLKVELKREQDSGRREHLAIMGLFYNDLMLNYDRSDRECERCHNVKPHGEFEIVTTKYAEKKYWGQRNICRTCQNKERVKRQHRSRKQKHFTVGGIQCY